MKSSELQQFLDSTLPRDGFELDEEQAALTYGDRAAWAVYYRRSDCKLQICWSARDGGIDFMLGALDAPNELGPVNSSKTWQFMLMLDGSKDDLETPGPGAEAPAVMQWLMALYMAHFDAARAALLARR